MRAVLRAIVVMIASLRGHYPDQVRRVWSQLRRRLVCGAAPPADARAALKGPRGSQCSGIGPSIVAIVGTVIATKGGLSRSLPSVHWTPCLPGTIRRGVRIRPTIEGVHHVPPAQPVRLARRAHLRTGAGRGRAAAGAA